MSRKRKSTFDDLVVTYQADSDSDDLLNRRKANAALAYHNRNRNHKHNHNNNRNHNNNNNRNRNKFKGEIINRYTLNEEITDGVKIYKMEENPKKFSKDIMNIGDEVCRTKIDKSYLKYLSNKIKNNKGSGFFVYDCSCTRNKLLGFVYYSEKTENPTKPLLLITKKKIKPIIERKILYIDLICTRKNKGFRGFRLGEILLDYVVDDAIDRNIPFIELNSVPSAVKIYSIYGFKRGSKTTYIGTSTSKSRKNLTSMKLTVSKKVRERNNNMAQIQSSSKRQVREWNNNMELPSHKRRRRVRERNNNIAQLQPSPKRRGRGDALEDFKLQRVLQKSKAPKNGGKKKVRKHKGIVQTGGKKGKLRKGYRYSGKKLKSGLPQIIKCKSKKC